MNTTAIEGSAGQSVAEQRDAAGYPGPRISRVTAELALGVGAVVLAGWGLGIVRLQNLAPSLSSMKANTALSIFLLGGALWLRGTQKIKESARFAARMAAGGSGLIAALTLLEYVFSLHLGIDQLLFSDPLTTHHPGRMGMNTATSITFLAISLLTMDADAKIRWAPLGTAIAGGGIASTALLGYLFSVQSLTGFGSYTQMALHTSICLTALGVGIVSLQPLPGLAMLRSDPESLRPLTKRLLMTILIAPLVGGWLALWGARLGLYGVEFGLPVLAGFLSVALTLCAYSTGVMMAGINTQRRSAEDELRRSEAHLRAILDTEPECVKLLTPDCRLLEMNKAGLAMIEVEKAESVLGQSVLPLVDEPYREPFRALTAGVFEGVSGELEFEATGMRGTRLWLETRATPLRDEKGNILSALGITRDVTAHKMAEQKLRASERRFISIFSSSPEAISISDLESERYLEVNRAFLKMMGYEREEAVGRSAQELGLLQKPEMRMRLRETLQRSGAVSAFQMNLRRRNGQVFAAEVSADIVELEGTKCLLSVTRDVSEKRKLEEQLRQAQKMEAIGQLAGGVAHDFNNLLMVMTSYAELIRENPGTNQKIFDYAKQILEAGKSAESVTRQLLAFSRKQVMDFRIQNLNEALRGLGKMLPRLIGENIEVVFALDENMPPVRFDRGQIEQVVLNLAVNARDAMPRGGKLTIATAVHEMDEAYLRDHPPALPGKYALLAVTDTGEGMDQETQARIFEPFFTTKAVGKGTGLGLATVYGIVKQSDGFIWVYSELGRGTAFKIYLPIASSAEEQAEAIAESAGPRRGTETILLVEDENSLRTLVQEYLTSWGYSVLRAGNGAEALQVCQNAGKTPDLIVTDMVMPGEMNGMEVIAAVRRMYPGIKAILMSGYTDPNVERNLTGGVFLQKPVSLRKLNATIRNSLLSAPNA